MYVCMYVYIHIYTCINIYINTHTHDSKYIKACVVCVCGCLCVNTRACTHIHEYIQHK